MGILITEKEMLKLGFSKIDTIIGPSFGIQVPTNSYKYLGISFILNYKDCYYLMIREGNIHDSRDKDVIVCLRDDVRFIEQIKDFYKAVTDKEL